MDFRLEGHHKAGIENFLDYAPDLVASLRKAFEDWSRTILPEGILIYSLHYCTLN
jgi:hypothetical protein